jgi:LCP family protein required for cell wall assembly
MDKPLKVDLLGGEAEQKARKTTAIIAVVFAVSVGLLAAIGAGASYRAAARGTGVLSEVGNLPILASIRQIAWGGNNADLLNTPDNRLTFLLFGVGGQGHGGPELTDTILLASVDLQTNDVGIMSIPRDLAFPLGGGRFIKINAVNAYAEQSNPGRGAREAADAYEELLDVRIDHVIKINFKAFVEFVDALGGIDVNVERSFTDREYPTYDDKWQVVSFNAGEQHMDGETALEYVRSRHGSNGEGSDFARSRRQQIVLLAVKEKLLSLGTLTRPDKLIKLYESIASNTQTDLTAWEIIKLAPLAKNISADNVTTHVLSNGVDGELVNSTVNGAYMLFPRERDWSEIRAIAQNPFATDEELDAAELAPAQTVTVEVRNGTNITGFASRMSQHLEEEGYVVQAIGNASERGYEKTVIYDLTDGARADELAKLKTMLRANVSASLPTWAGTSTSDAEEQRPTDDEHTDFLIVLGDASYDLVK